MGNFVKNQFDEWEFVSDSGVHYDIEEGVSRRHGGHSTRIYVLVSESYLFSHDREDLADICIDLLGYHPLVDYWYGVDYLDHIDDGDTNWDVSTFIQDLDDCTSEYEKKHPEIVDIFYACDNDLEYDSYNI